MNPVGGRFERVKLFFARWLYRWGQASSILGAVFTALTFAGVFTILLGPLLGPLGVGYSETLVLLVAFVVVLFLGAGYFLDHVVRFWTAQVEIGTVRNPYLFDRLYQKELLQLQSIVLPQLRALRFLVQAELRRDDTGEGRERLSALVDAIDRVALTARDKKWDIRPGERVYDENQP